jgi:hypothetical protein
VTQDERYKQAASDAVKLINERMAMFSTEDRPKGLVTLIAAMLIEIDDLRNEVVRQALLITGTSSPNETAPLCDSPKN